ncbi:hypothetical protein [Streptomyces antarcticus]|uniref:hypothetical protein n=1 Tax=Streptomyces antarcticus TaxID=2996458 RepID=UPI0022AFC455|nr:hypothetical protein [Streptomyces sp. H34-S5]MCZ4085084.1 hypothetical protein [Streptomyces sp. H34-S5]
MASSVFSGGSDTRNSRNQRPPSTVATIFFAWLQRLVHASTMPAGGRRTRAAMISAGCCHQRREGGAGVKP